MRVTPRRFAHTAIAAAVAFSAATVAPFVSGSASAAAKPVDVIVEIHDYNIRPLEIVATAGGTITFHNAGSATHRIVTDDGSFDSRGLEPDAIATMGAPNVGSVRIHCELHPSMTADMTINTAPAPLAAPSTTTGTGGSTPGGIATATTKPPLPANLAATGAAETALLGIGVGCLLCGIAALIAHRRYRQTARFAPAEAAWRSVTVGQRHHDDLLARPLSPRRR